MSVGKIEAGLSSDVSTRPRPWLSPKSALAGFGFSAGVIVVGRLVPALRPVVSGCGGTAGRTRRRGRPCQGSTGGCNASRRCWPTPPASAATDRGTGGSLTRRTSRSTVCGGTCTAPQTSMGRSSTCSSRPGRDTDAARRFFRRTLSALTVMPGEVVTDAAAVYPGVLDELIPFAWHHVEQYANNPIEADHRRLKGRLRPMRGLRLPNSPKRSDHGPNTDGDDENGSGLDVGSARRCDSASAAAWASLMTVAGRRVAVWSSDW